MQIAEEQATASKAITKPREVIAWSEYMEVTVFESCGDGAVLSIVVDKRTR